MPSDDPQEILASCKRVAAILQEAKIPFALGGGIACWVYGAPESDHDVDVMVREEDARGAQELLVAHGMKPEDPPEEWLLKVYDGDVLVDLIFRPEGLTITDEVLDRAPVRDVNAMKMKVLRLEDVFITKLLSYNEHHLDFLGLLAVARAVREQLDWAEVARRTDHSPFAAAFLTLVERLGIVGEPLEAAG
ncbi:MAG TPA: nucleotidyltransferase [Frankiaceae bacterium]|nr:nucleotidyltransferase [Frankiaceae bacterium]